ncbi:MULTISPECIES: glycerol-3-phosphate 1-O-acyltransferase PlsY [unclassified Marinovum]
MPAIETALSGLIIWSLFGYLLGSIPFGIVIARMLGLGDLRKIGSGNIGATNVLRTGNKPAALATLILDSFKGAAAVLIARAVAAEDAAQLAGLFAFLGHCFPVWLGFKGGKGVATFLGLLLGLAFPLGLAACATWGVGAVLTRISSASALLAAALSPVMAWLLGYPSMVVLCAVLAVIVWGRHHANISRILSGEEPRIGKKG